MIWGSRHQISRIKMQKGVLRPTTWQFTNLCAKQGAAIDPKILIWLTIVTSLLHKFIFLITFNFLKSILQLHSRRPSTRSLFLALVGQVLMTSFQSAMIIKFWDGIWFRQKLSKWQNYPKISTQLTCIICPGKFFECFYQYSLFLLPLRRSNPDHGTILL